jgi:FixJ family two-component response regulator
VANLSPDELESLRGVVAGESIEITAQRLEISFRIAELHRRNMMDKLGAVLTCDAVRVGLYAELDNRH